MIQTIAVLGAGTMGHGIAHTFSRHGYQVNLYEPFDAVRESAPQKIREELQFMVDEGYITEADRDNGIRNITMYASLEDTARDADYVIEACPEKMELKQKLFSQLDAVCKPTAVFATNTSSLKLSEMIAHLPPERQARCMVSHWYNPAYLIPIAELSKFGNMPEDVFQEVYDLYVACEKQPVRVLKDITGMVANRILHAQAPLPVAVQLSEHLGGAHGVPCCNIPLPFDFHVFPVFRPQYSRGPVQIWGKAGEGRKNRRAPGPPAGGRFSFPPAPGRRRSRSGAPERRPPGQ